MESEWALTRLGDLVTLRGGLAYDGRLIGESGDALITMGCVSRSERFNPTGLRRYAGEAGDQHRLNFGDLVIATRDVTQNREVIGAPALIPAELPGHAILATNMYRVINHSEAETAFLYWLLRGREYREHIVASAKGTTVIMITKNAVEDFRFLLPPLSEQRAIAHLLSTLDNKIDLIRRRNQTLEAMARALFKDWFVDFGPVRAKMEGLEPYLPADLWQFFPERLDAKGKPEGWQTGVLGGVAAHPRRSVTPAGIKQGTPYIALEHMPKKCIALADWGFANGLESNKFEFRKGEILFGKLRPYFHKVGVAPVDGVCSTDIVVIEPKDSCWFGFLVSLVSSTEFVDYTNAGSTGTKMPRTSWAEMARYELTLPPRRVVDVFNKIVHTWVDQIVASIHESRTLSQLRDTLLPKLVSGELRIKDVNKLMEHVA